MCRQRHMPLAAHQLRLRLAPPAATKFTCSGTTHPLEAHDGFPRRNKLGLVRALRPHLPRLRQQQGQISVLHGVLRELVPPVAVTHAVGPMWAVNGQALVVSAGEDLRRTVLDTVARIANATGACSAWSSRTATE